MALYLVTCEDGDGMWYDEPVGADDEDAAYRCAVEKWPTLPAGITLVLYRCHEMDEIPRPGRGSAGVSSKGAEDEKGTA